MTTHRQDVYIMISSNLKDDINVSTTLKACPQYHEGYHVFFPELLAPVRSQGTVYASTYRILTKENGKKQDIRKKKETLLFISDNYIRSKAERVLR